MINLIRSLRKKEVYYDTIDVKQKRRNQVYPTNNSIPPDESPKKVLRRHLSESVSNDYVKYDNFLDEVIYKNDKEIIILKYERRVLYGTLRFSIICINFLRDYIDNNIHYFIFCIHSNNQVL